MLLVFCHFSRPISLRFRLLHETKSNLSCSLFTYGRPVWQWFSTISECHNRPIGPMPQICSLVWVKFEKVNIDMWSQILSMFSKNLTVKTLKTWLTTDWIGAESTLSLTCSVEYVKEAGEKTSRGYNCRFPTAEKFQPHSKTDLSRCFGRRLQRRLVLILIYFTGKIR